MRIGKAGLDLNVESTLVGVSMALPEPFAKLAQEALPLRVEYSSRSDAEFLRRAKAPGLSAGGDAFAITLGNRASGIFMRRKSGNAYVLERGALGVGESPPLVAVSKARCASFAASS